MYVTGGVADVADAGVPQRRARLGVVGDEVAAGIAREHELAGRRQQAAATATAAKPTAAPGYGRRQTILPVVGSIAVR